MNFCLSASCWATWSDRIRNTKHNMGIYIYIYILRDGWDIPIYVGFYICIYIYVCIFGICMDMWFWNNHLICFRWRPTRTIPGIKAICHWGIPSTKRLVHDSHVMAEKYRIWRTYGRHLWIQVCFVDVCRADWIADPKNFIAMKHGNGETIAQSWDEGSKF